MQNNYASCHYVVTTTPTYCTALVDLSRSRSVHAVEHNPCCPDPTILSASQCKAVHHGLCSPLLKLPTFSIPPVTSSNLNSPTSVKGASQTQSPNDAGSPKSRSSSSNSNSPKHTSPNAGAHSSVSPSTAKSAQYHPLAGVSKPTEAGPQNIIPPAVNSVTPNPTPMSKVDLDIFDPVELLAVDLEGQLEALVSTFVAQDKVRLAARKKGDVSPIVSKSPSPMQEKKTSAGTTDVARPESVSTERKPQEDDFSVRSETGSPYPIKNNHDRQNDNYMDVLDNVSPFKDGMSVAKQSLEFLQSKSTSPSILSPLKPSPEYQQCGVKAQITKFSSREKDATHSPVNSLERRQGKTKSEITNPSFKQGPLSLDELQELLKSTSEPIDEPIKTTIFENTRMPSIHYDSSVVPPTLDIVSFQQRQPNQLNQEPLGFVHQCNVPNSSEVIYQNIEAIKAFENSSHLKDFDEVHQTNMAFRLNPSQEFVQSPVDYAKSRFLNVQQGSRLQEDDRPRPKNGQVVNEARCKWEPQQHWSTSLSDQQMITNGGDPRSIEGLLELPSPSIPHPKLTNVQKQHIKERSLSPTDRHSHVPIRPFLTKGSVAERVLLFECCPDRAMERATSGAKNKNILINTWRTGGSDVHNKMQSHNHPNRDKENVDPASLRTNSLRRFASAKLPSSNKIPRFYYPDGKPATPAEVESHLKKVAAVFAGLTEGKAARDEFGIITKACGLPLYWKLPLFLAARGDKRAAVSCDAFLEYWRRVVNACHDESSKFVFNLTKGSRNYLLPEDFIPLMEDVIDSHPGLTFLKEATEFHSRYISTVIARIYYCVNRSWSGKITVPELRKSNFLQILSTLEEEEDINQITDYFSYEHFYVIYCKFWELDKDHDLYIDQNDLRHHNGGALSTKIIQRIFSGAVTRGPIQKEGKMVYTEFVWFLISEEDKRHPRSIEYWFRCMDLDGDGYLSMFELEYFYEEQLHRLEALGIETLPFNDCLCQMLDIIKPRVPGKVSLADLKKCKMTPIFFDTFFNLEKYLDHEQRDPFASQREHDGEGPELSDWDRYAADEYELLVAEEGAVEQQDELMYDEAESSSRGRTSSSSNNTGKNDFNRRVKSSSEDDECDYAETDADYKF